KRGHMHLPSHSVPERTRSRSPLPRPDRETSAFHSITADCLGSSTSTRSVGAMNQSSHSLWGGPTRMQVGRILPGHPPPRMPGDGQHAPSPCGSHARNPRLLALSIRETPEVEVRAIGRLDVETRRLVHVMVWVFFINKCKHSRLESRFSSPARLSP